jgi:hypothetical protein
LDLLEALISKCKEHPEVMFQEVFMRYEDQAYGSRDQSDDPDPYEDNQIAVKFDGFSVYIEAADLEEQLGYEVTTEPAVWPHSKDYAVRRNT